MKSFFAKNKKILLLFLPSLFLYVLFNYLPFKTWIPNEIGYLCTELALYVSLSFFVIFFKKKWDIEIERPRKEISFFYLLAFLIPCFANLTYHYIDTDTQARACDWILGLELIVDLSASVIEDVTFVDLWIAFILNNTKMKYKNFFAVMTSSLLFTLVHCYTFLNNSWEMSLVLLTWVFLLTVECGYLAIFFNSFLLPVGFHFVFNAINYVIFNAMYGVQINGHYVLFNAVLWVTIIFYILALWHLSELQAFKHSIENPEQK